MNSDFIWNKNPKLVEAFGDQVSPCPSEFISSHSGWCPTTVATLDLCWVLEHVCLLCIRTSATFFYFCLNALPRHVLKYSYSLHSDILVWMSLYITCLPPRDLLVGVVVNIVVWIFIPDNKYSWASLHVYQPCGYSLLEVPVYGISYFSIGLSVQLIFRI